MVISQLTEEFRQKFGEQGYVDNKARKLPTNPLFDLTKQEEGDTEKKKQRFASISVQDKHDPKRYDSIFEVSLPLKLLSQRSINLVRFYVPRERKEDAAAWCRQRYDEIYSKVKEIEKGWI